MPEIKTRDGTKTDTAQGVRTAGLDVVRVTKQFGNTRALDDVTLRIEPGTVHALIGENGAGKSTLGKVISGVLQPDAGGIAIGEMPVVLRSPRDALGFGIATIEQEISLAPNLSAESNVFLGVEPQRAGMINQRQLRERWQTVAASNRTGVLPTALVGQLSLGLCQQIEILRATSRGADLIVMDEPTAALGRDEALALQQDIRELRDAGVTVLIISHFIKEVLALCDTVSVLRGGRLIRSAPAREETEQSLIQAMLGRPLGTVFKRKQVVSAAAPAVLEGRGLVAPGVDGVTLSVRAGEITGVGGLDGSGRLEVGLAMYGRLPLFAGEVRVAGKSIGRPNPRRSLAQGVSLIPESRKDDGLFLSRSVVENATIGCLSGLSTLGILRARSERRFAEKRLTNLGVPAKRLTDAVGTLSGGNQQKVLFARVMLQDPVALIAIEPTRGIDVGAKASIYALLTDLAESGVGILLISSEQEELLGLAHRIVVMRHGRVGGELAGAEMTQERILSAAFGGAPEPARTEQS
jgi:simple sugar transport system ATP-binding protein/ribose transport system ATP-binding protein